MGHDACRQPRPPTFAPRLVVFPSGLSSISLFTAGFTLIPQTFCLHKFITICLPCKGYQFDWKSDLAFDSENHIILD